MGDLCTKAGERETRQKNVSLPPKAGELASLGIWEVREKTINDGRGVVPPSGGVLFCNLSNGQHFYKFFCLCKRENFEKLLKKCCRIQIRKRMFIQQINQGYLTLQ